MSLKIKIFFLKSPSKIVDFENSTMLGCKIIKIIFGLIYFNKLY